MKRVISKLVLCWKVFLIILTVIRVNSHVLPCVYVYVHADFVFLESLITDFAGEALFMMFLTVFGQVTKLSKLFSACLALKAGSV